MMGSSLRTMDSLNLNHVLSDTLVVAWVRWRMTLGSGSTNSGRFQKLWQYLTGNDALEGFLDISGEYPRVIKHGNGKWTSYQ